MMLPAVCYWVVSVRLIQRGGMAAECLGSPRSGFQLIPHKQSPWSGFVLFAGILGCRGGGKPSGNGVKMTRNAAGNAVFSLAKNWLARLFWRENRAESVERGSFQGPRYGVRVPNG